MIKTEILLDSVILIDHFNQIHQASSAMSVQASLLRVMPGSAGVKFLVYFPIFR